MPQQTFTSLFRKTLEIMMALFVFVAWLAATFQVIRVYQQRGEDIKNNLLPFTVIGLLFAGGLWGLHSIEQDGPSDPTGAGMYVAVVIWPVLLIAAVTSGIAMFRPATQLIGRLMMIASLALIFYSCATLSAISPV